MGYNKIINLLGKLDKDEIPKFTTIKWIEIFDRSNATYNPNKDIRFKTPQITSDLCDFIETYIVVTGTITVANPGNNNDVYNKKVSLKNSAPFFNCILKINNQLIEDAKDLDIVIPMYNLLNYSKNFRKTAGSFGTIIQTNQIQDTVNNKMVKLIIFMKEKKYFTQLEIQKVLIIKLN